MKELANCARRGELLSPKSKEWQQQNTRFQNMLKLMQEDDKKKKEDRKDIKKTADSAKEIATAMKKALMK